jgi:rod shape-determining protein MreB
MAAAIGAGLPVEEASGSMVVDIGGGTSEVAILALNGVVYANSLKVGGDRLDESIISYVRRNQGVLIGDATAERVKHTIGTASPDSEITEMEVRGRNLAEGIPITFQMNSKQVYDAMLEPLSAIVQAIRTALEQSPPELSADISERGIVLTGGGALLRDIDVLISNQTGIPVLVAEDPLTCVAKGGGSALEIMDKYDIDLLSTE